MAVYLSSFGGAGAQFFDNNGVPLAGGLIYTYAAGTTTPQATYTSNSGSIAQSNPIVLDSSGRVPSGEIWLLQVIPYKFVLQTSGGTTIGTYDNISSIAGSIPVITDFTATGSQVNFTLSISPTNLNTTNIFINGVYQNKNSYSISGTTLTFTQAPPVNSVVEVSYA
jgi:hypothetical protein